MGAALAYYTLLSLLPLLLVAISVVGLVFGASGAEGRVMHQVQFLLGEQRASIIDALLRGAQSRTDGVLATVAGLLILTFGATGVLVELRGALNTIWEVPVPQQSTLQEFSAIVRERLWSLALVFGIILIVTASLLFGTSISALGTVASLLPAHEVILHLLNAGASFIAITIVFGAIYKFVPQVPLTWPDVILGASVSSVLFTLGNILLGLYLGKVSFSSTYGAASSTVVLAVWVYYSSQIFFLGAEFTRAFAAHFGSARRRKRNAGATTHPGVTGLRPSA